MRHTLVFETRTGISAVCYAEGLTGPFDAELVYGYVLQFFSEGKNLTCRKHK